MTDRQGPYALFILALSILSLVGLALLTVPGIEPEERRIVAYADNAICLLFFTDFLYSLYRAPNRWGYFLRWGWIDLLSSVPMVDAFRLGRFARIFRILRVLRGVRAAKIIAEFLLARRAQSAFLAVSLVSMLLVVVASIAILQFETDAGSNIKTAEDAIWWALTTITTVGYGDRFPVTTEGRAVASVLMVCGVGLFGTLSGFIASWFLKPQDATQASELDALAREVAALRVQLEARDQEDSGQQVRGWDDTDPRAAPASHHR